MSHPFAFTAAALLIPILSAADAVARADAPAAAATSQPTAQISDADFDAALERAAAGETGKPAFVAAIQSVAPRFAAVAVSTEPGAGVWNAVTLNSRGKRVDAIRFRVPDDQPRDLLWAFAFPPGMKVWYIAPAEGAPGKGFENFRKASPAELFGRDAAPPDVTGGIIQTLAGQHLDPGREYLIWFTFEDAEPRTLYVAIALLPTAGKPNASTAIKGLGLPRPVQPATQPAEAPVH